MGARFTTSADPHTLPPEEFQDYFSQYQDQDRWSNSSPSVCSERYHTPAAFVPYCDFLYETDLYLKIFSGRLMKSFAFHNILDFLREDEVLRLQGICKVLYSQVIPRYCSRMRDHKREMVFYGALPHKRVLPKRMLGFNGFSKAFYKYDVLKGEVKYLNTKIFTLKPNCKSGSSRSSVDFSLLEMKDKSLIKSFRVTHRYNNFCFVQGSLGKVVRTNEGFRQTTTHIEYRDFFGYLQLQFKDCRIFEHDYFDSQLPSSQANIGRFIYRVTRLSRTIQKLDLLFPMKGFEDMENITAGNILDFQNLIAVQQRYLYSYRCNLTVAGNCAEIFSFDTFKDPKCQSWKKLQIRFQRDFASEAKLFAKVSQVTYRNFSHQYGLFLSNPSCPDTQFFFTISAPKWKQKSLWIKCDKIGSQVSPPATSPSDETGDVGSSRSHFWIDSISTHQFKLILKLAKKDPSALIRQQYCKASYRVSVYLYQQPDEAGKVLACLIDVYDYNPGPHEQYQVVKAYVRFAAESSEEAAPMLSDR